MGSRDLVGRVDRRKHSDYGGLVVSDHKCQQSYDSIALMQHTLLIQIFRLNDSQYGGLSEKGNNSSLQCPTCSQWSNVCCQMESGWSVLASIVTTLSRVRYQGYVCPGMLVLLTNDQGVKVIQE